MQWSKVWLVDMPSDTARDIKPAFPDCRIENVVCIHVPGHKAVGAALL
jgi:hypothetical protein